MMHPRRSHEMAILCSHRELAQPRKVVVYLASCGGRRGAFRSDRLGDAKGDMTVAEVDIVLIRVKDEVCANWSFAYSTAHATLEEEVN